MRTLLRNYLEHDLSRRDFTKSMLAMGFGASAINAVLDSAAMAAAPSSAEAYEVEGSGGLICVECFRAAGIEYVFDHGPSANLDQHFRQCGLHPCPFAGGHDHCYGVDIHACNKLRLKERSAT